MNSPAKPTSVRPEDRVPVGQKVAYGLGSANDMWGNWLYPGMVWPVFQMYLHVSPGLVSTALMINRLVDAVSDPFFGWLSDNTRTRWGRRRPFILVGSILSGLSLPLLFCVGRGWSEWSYFWFMVVSSSIFITIVSSFNMPYQSLGNELTPDYQERTSVFSFKSGIQKLPEIAMFFAAAFVTLNVFKDSSGEPNSLFGAQVYTVLLGGLMIVVGIVVFFGVRERYYDKVVEQQAKVAISESIWKTLRCRPFRAQLAMALAYGIGTSMVGTLGYYATVYYVCIGDRQAGNFWNFYMGLANTGIGFVGVPVFAWLAHRLGKQRAMSIVLLTAMVVFVSTWWLYNPAAPLLQIFASGFIAFTGVGFWMLYGSIGADVIDFDELETGKRREGAFTACATWILKVGLALGMGFSGMILGATGFDEKLGGAQSAETLFAIRFWLAAIPVIGLAVALGALSMFGLTRERVLEIRRELEARRGAV
jgi:GPH family glycoside/pentoside/hexuronide:cation symporter